jgi:hypothetical protein
MSNDKDKPRQNRTHTKQLRVKPKTMSDQESKVIASMERQQELSATLEESTADETAASSTRTVTTLRNNLASRLARASGWLSSAEKIFVLHRTANWANIRSREQVNLLMAAGCYSEAIPMYEAIGHWRKVGDAQLALGDIDAARKSYERGENKQKDTYAAFRTGPDFDRLIALAIEREDWREVLNLVRTAKPDPLGKRDVIFAGGNRAKAPLVKLCAHAAWKSGDASIVDDMPDFFGLNTADLKVIFANATSGTFERDVAKLKMPSFLKIKPETLASVLGTGDTPYADQVIKFFETLEAGYMDAIHDVQSWRSSGEKARLDSAIFWLTRIGSYELFECCLFQLKCDLDVWNEPHRTDIELYVSHAWLTRACMSELLTNLIKRRRKPTPKVLLSCAIQHSTSPFELDFEKLETKDRVMEQIRCHLTWAETVVERWSANGKLTHHWSKVCAAADPEFRTDPRRVPAYATLCDEVIEALKAAWARDFNEIQWKAEEGTFLALKTMLPDTQIVRHARPSWLVPQHLDIFLPEYAVAIEYQGEQHYRPIEIFGGARGLAITVERDERKKRICYLAGVKLEYIRYDESIDERLRQIVDACRSKRDAAVMSNTG